MVCGLLVVGVALEVFGTGAVLLVALVMGLALVLLLALIVLERIDSTALTEFRTIFITDILCNLLHLLWRSHPMSITSRQLFPQLLILILHSLIRLLLLFLQLCHLSS